jgi:hypothetical protein
MFGLRKRRPNALIAANTQPIRTSADAADRAGRDHAGMDSASPIVELADRHSSDLDVVLLWGKGSGRLWVLVTHRGSGRTARINATPANALEVFHHPFAYGGGSI